MKANSSPLRLGLASIKKRDSSRFRQHLFSNLLKERLILRIAFRAFEYRLLKPALSIGLAASSIRRFFQMQIETGLAGEIAVFHYNNERRAIRNVYPFKNFICYSSRFSFVFLKEIRTLPFSKILQWLRVSMHLLKKNGFLAGARQSEFLLLYGFYRSIFVRRDIRDRTFLSSSEANPEVISVLLAAKSLGNKTIFLNHSALEKEQGIFFHDEIVLSAFNRGEICKLNFPDFNSIKRIGFACSQVTSRELLTAAVNSCLESFPHSEIVIRQHPNATFSPVHEQWFEGSARVKVLKREEQSPLTDLCGWDFAIAGNSSVHLDLLTLGIPTVHQNIDGIDWDLYDFIESGLVPSVTKGADISTTMNAVYSRENWQNIFFRFCGAADTWL